MDTMHTDELVTQLCEHPGCGKPVRTAGRTTHYGCDLLAKGFSIAGSATPTRVACRPQPLRPMQDPSWEKGIAGEHRPDGSFVPYLTDSDSRAPMGVKEYAERRTEVDAQVKRLKADPTVFSERS